MKKGIEGIYYIKYDLEKKEEFVGRCEEVVKLLNDERTEYHIFFGTHRDFGSAISIRIFVKASTNSLVEEKLNVSKDIIEKKLGELNLIMETYFDLRNEDK